MERERERERWEREIAWVNHNLIIFEAKMLWYNSLARILLNTENQYALYIFFNITILVWNQIRFRNRETEYLCDFIFYEIVTLIYSNKNSMYLIFA